MLFQQARKAPFVLFLHIHSWRCIQYSENKRWLDFSKQTGPSFHTYLH